MNFPPYPFETVSDADENTIYAFVSISKQRDVQKVVLFTLSGRNIYNMALLDVLDTGELSDTAVSNNQDMKTVLATVIQILIDFLRRKPTATVTFMGSTPARTRLYRIIIDTYLTDIQASFLTSGITQENRIESFQVNQNYTGFVVSLV